MIICSGCGHANGATDAFCGSCGGFLEWAGEPVPAAAAPAPVAPPAAKAPVAVSAPVPAPRPEQAPAAMVLASPAASLVPPVPPVREPQAEHARPAPVRPDPLDVGPADLYCGGCGGGNAEGRAFCRRCGSTLADATRTPRLAWWTRLWRRLRDRPAHRRTLTAGERPDGWATTSEASSGGSRKRRWWRPRMPARLSLGKLALPLALLSLVGFGIAPIRAAVTTKAFDIFHQGRSVVAPRYVPVSASGASASSSAQAHDASMAIDQNTLTWWAEGKAGRGKGERLTVRFDRPVDLARLTVHGGAAEAQWPFQPRVRGLRVTLRGPAGVVDERRVVLADRRGLQEIEVSGSGVTRVTLRILSAYAGQKGTAASLAEVAFLAKQ